MNPILIFGILIAYFATLLIVAHFTGKTNNEKEFFNAGKAAPWYLVAFGMVGASLSGVTFISVPGWVKMTNFSYLQMIFGYLLGYLVIALVLMPLYYRLNLVTIYSYLGIRLGTISHKTCSVFFLISRLIGSALRLYLASLVLYTFIFQDWNISFELTVVITIALIWLYTFKGGIKTIIWTDTFQTFFMILALVITIIILKDALEIPFLDLPKTIYAHDYSQTLFFDWADKKHFFKQFIGGAFITLTMTGMDQDMMQKNLTCRNIGEAQKNMLWFSVVLVLVNILFLGLGVLLYMYAEKNGISVEGDALFPFLAKNHLGTAAAIVFFLGVIAAAYSSADSAMAALTTSVCYDFIDIEGKNWSEEKRKKIRILTHIIISIAMLLVIIIFSKFNDKNVIDLVFRVAGYTYGPILGLFSYAILTKRKVLDIMTPVICVISPLLIYFLDVNGKEWFGVALGYELLPINGLLTFLLLWLFSFIAKK
jgi:Na+/proline symporter